MDAETLLPPETLEKLHQAAEPEVWIKVTESDMTRLSRYLAIDIPLPDMRRDWMRRVRVALANAMVAPRTPDGNRLFAVSVAVHTNLLGNLTAAAIIDAQEVTD